MKRVTEHRGEEGFTLLGMVVAIFLVMLALGVAAPRVAKELRRDREVEAMHRGGAVCTGRAGLLPEARALSGVDRAVGKDEQYTVFAAEICGPDDGKPDWRIIKVGEAKTTVKGFFGQPLAGLPTQGAGGGIQGASTPGTPIGGSPVGAGGSTAGGSSAFGGASGAGTSGLGGSTGGSALGGSTGGLGAGLAGDGCDWSWWRRCDRYRDWCGHGRRSGGVNGCYRDRRGVCGGGELCDR